MTIVHLRAQPLLFLFKGSHLFFRDRVLVIFWSAYAILYHLAQNQREIFNKHICHINRSLDGYSFLEVFEFLTKTMDMIPATLPLMSFSLVNSKYQGQSPL